VNFTSNLNQRKRQEVKNVHVDLSFVLNAQEKHILLALATKRRIGSKKNLKGEEICFGFGKIQKCVLTKAVNTLSKRTWGAII